MRPRSKTGSERSVFFPMGKPRTFVENAQMPSTHRSRGSGARALAHLGLLLAATALALFCLSALSGDRVNAKPPNPPRGDGVHPGGGNGGLDNSAHTLR